ncbi:MAG: YceI family protein [Vicingaceae bacterium]
MKKIVFSAILIAGISAFTGCSNNKNEEETTVKEQICFYEYDHASTKLEWTAYKTTAKVGVGGTFNEIKVIGGEKSSKVTDVLKSIKFTIPTNSTNTTNADRDKKIIEHFFGVMQGTDLIIGQVANVEGDDKSGLCKIYINMNGIEQEVPFAYTVDDNVHVVLDGEIDMNNWNGQAAIDSLNTLCYDLHKGEDGESKLWPNVTIKIETTLKKTCN